MKKRHLLLLSVFCSVFVVTLIGSYLVFAWQMQQPKHVRRPKVKMLVNPTKLTSPNNSKIKIQGLARYLNGPNRCFREKMGEPAEIFQNKANDLALRWEYYDLPRNAFLKVGVSPLNDRLKEIIACGQVEPKFVKPFKMGMTLAELTHVSPLYSNFKVKVNDQSYQIVLNEQQMMHLPLFEFSQHRFATTYLNQNTQKVQAISYFKPREILSQNIYQIVGNTPTPTAYNGNFDWDILSEQQVYDLIKLVNAEHELVKAPAVDNTSLIQSQAQSLLAQIKDKPKSFFKGLDWKKYHKIATGRIYDNLHDPLIKVMPIPDEPTQVAYLLGPDLNNLVFLNNEAVQQKILQPLLQSKVSEIGVAYEQSLMVIIAHKNN